MLKRIGYNRLLIKCRYSLNPKILYPKQFGFQTAHSSDYFVISLVENIENISISGVFIDLSRAFDTVISY